MPIAAAAAAIAGPLLIALAVTVAAARPGAIAWAIVAVLSLAVVAAGVRVIRRRNKTVATLSLTEPLTAALLGVVVLDERPGLLALLGALVLLSGLLVISTRPASIDEPLPEP